MDIIPHLVKAQESFLDIHHRLHPSKVKIYFNLHLYFCFFIYYREISNENNETEITDLDTEKFVPIAVECLAILIKLNDTIEVS